MPSPDTKGLRFNPRGLSCRRRSLRRIKQNDSDSDRQEELKDAQTKIDLKQGRGEGGSEEGAEISVAEEHETE